MPGFLGEISKKSLKKNFGKNFNSDYVNEEYCYKNFYTERRTIKKFMNDKAFSENEKYFVLTEGVILNKNKLFEKYNSENIFDLVVQMYEKKGEDFFKEFRGSFSGLFYDKNINKYIIYTDHVGDKQIFYSQQENFIFGSDIDYIIEYFKQNRIKYNLDDSGAYFLLTYGFMLEDYTLFKEIKKLKAGHYIVCEDNNINIKQYYELDNTPNYDLTEEEAIEGIDKLFRMAVKMEFEKDKEYGYKHIASLSGGLDSRMTVWVAHDLGYTKQLNYTFSQSDYLDEVISKNIARDLKHEWIFKFLDNGNYLCDVDSMVDINFGSCLYSGNSHAKDFIGTINTEKYGLIHTGQIGDVVIGTFYSTNEEGKKFKHGDGAYSFRLKKRLEEIKLKEEYPNEEIFKFYNRGFTGALQGNLPPQNYTEVTSPFIYKEFMDFCLKIPLKYRYNHYIYFKWIIKKYPDAAKYKWEKIGGKITDLKINIFGRYVTLKSLPKKVYIKVIKKGILNTKANMNPFDYWYKNNQNLRDFINNYYNENVNLLENYGQLGKDAKDIFSDGSMIEKTQTLTLLGVLKKYFGDNLDE